MSAVPPSSPSRRHFLGITAAVARKLSVLSVGTSALTLLGARDAFALDHEHERHHRWHFDGYRNGAQHGYGSGFGSGGAYGSGGGGHRSGSGRAAANGSGSAGSGTGTGSGSGSATGSGSGASGSGGSGAGGSGASVANGSAASGTDTSAVNGSASSGSDSTSGTGPVASASDGFGAGSGSGSSGSGSASSGLRCFARGTLILTANGEVAVEDLAIGTEVMTTNGPKPVKWIGHQTLQRNQAAAWHPRVLPVRICKFAIDDQTPRRDVCLSQHHSLYIDGVLIPARHLVNGKSIRFDEAALASDTLEYFHVEFETHEVIFADGMPVESFIYAGGMVGWDNLDAYHERYGEHRIMAPFAPVHSYEGGFDELGGLIRLVASRFVDVRDRIQIAHDRFKDRARQAA